MLAHDRRRIVHFAVTAHPTAEWTAQQLREAFPWDTAPRYLLRERDRILGKDFVDQVKAMGIQQVLSAPSWQRAYVERVIGTMRRECLDHRIVFGEGSINYHHRSRTHLVLAKDRANGWAVFESAACKLFYKREFYKRECQEKRNLMTGGPAHPR